MQDWRHHQILGPNSALVEILGQDDEAVFLELLPGTWGERFAERAWLCGFFKRGDRQ
jgi:hypothetical protein